MNSIQKIIYETSPTGLQFDSRIPMQRRRLLEQCLLDEQEATRREIARDEERDFKIRPWTMTPMEHAMVGSTGFDSSKPCEPIGITYGVLNPTEVAEVRRQWFPAKPIFDDYEYEVVPPPSSIYCIENSIEPFDGQNSIIAKSRYGDIDITLGFNGEDAFDFNALLSAVDFWGCLDPKGIGDHGLEAVLRRVLEYGSVYRDTIDFRFASSQDLTSAGRVSMPYLSSVNGNSTVNDVWFDNVDLPKRIRVAEMEVGPCTWFDRELGDDIRCYFTDEAVQFRMVS